MSYTSIIKTAQLRMLTLRLRYSPAKQKIKASAIIVKYEKIDFINMKTSLSLWIH